MGKNQSASNLTNIIKQDAGGNISFMSGSTMLMSLSNTGQVSGSSPAVSAISSSYALNATNAVSAISATTATTASYATNFTVTGNLTAQTLVVQTITSSVDFVTGSTRFGSVSGNTMQVTGSILTSGSIGIGTSVASYPLTVNSNTTQTSIGLLSGYSNSGARNWGIATNALAYGDLNIAQSNTSGSDPFSGTSRIYITQNGNVTITSGAGGTLTLVKTSNNIPALSFTGANYTSAIDGGDYMAFATSGSYRMYINASGSIGIGTTNPGYKLEIQTTGTSAALWVQTGGTTSGYTIADFRTGTNASAFQILGNTNSIFGGNVGIGTNSPGVPLEVRGAKPNIASTDNGIVTITDNTGYSSGTGGSLVFRGVYNSSTSTALAAAIEATKDNSTDGNYGYGMNFYTRTHGASSNVKMNISSAGDLYLYNGAFQQQGLWVVNNVGFTTGNGAFTFDVGVGDEGGGGNIFKVEAGFAHYSGMGYNCLAEFYISTRGTGYEITDVKRVDSGNAGSFTAWKPDNSTLRVAKVAGTYGGGGRYWIRVTKVTY